MDTARGFMTCGVSEFISRTTNNYDYLRNILPRIPFNILHHFHLVDKAKFRTNDDFKCRFTYSMVQGPS